MKFTLTIPSLCSLCSLWLFFSSFFQLPASPLSSASPVVLITGCSSGIGQATAHHLSESGYIVYAGVRTLPSSPSPSPYLHYIKLDVCSEEDIVTAVSTILSAHSHIDILINNAALGIFGPMETISIAQAKRLFDVNFFGAMRLIQEVLPHMREQHSGLILNVTSTNGIRAGVMWDLYASSKFAVEGLSEALALTASHWNIRVALVEPGAVHTPFIDTAERGERFDMFQNPYAIFVANGLRYLIMRRDQGQDPLEIATFIREVIESPTPHFRNQTSEQARTSAAMKLVDTTGDALLQHQLKLCTPFWGHTSE